MAQPTNAAVDLTACHVMDGLLVAIAAATYLAVVGAAVWAIGSLLRGSLPVYAGDPGQWAWVLHRATGLGVLFFLFVHIVDIMFVGLGPAVYDCTVSFYASPFIVPMEVALVGAVIYHAINGIRLMLFDFTATGVRRERELFYAALALSVLLVLPSVYVIVAQH